MFLLELSTCFDLRTICTNDYSAVYRCKEDSMTTACDYRKAQSESNTSLILLESKTFLCCALRKYFLWLHHLPLVTARPLIFPQQTVFVADTLFTLGTLPDSPGVGSSWPTTVAPRIGNGYEAAHKSQQSNFLLYFQKIKCLKVLSHSGMTCDYRLWLLKEGRRSPTKYYLIHL